MGTPADAVPAEPPPEQTSADTVAAEPPGDDPRWEAYAPVPTRPPGRVRRAIEAAGRGFGHEWSLAVLGGVLLAVVMTWPTLRYPRHTLPQDLGDPALVTWILAWPGHVLFSDPANLWHGNAFFPDSRWSLAFTDSLLGYAPLSLIGDGIGDAILRYNLIFVFAHALAFIGGYALLRQLGAHPAAALVAGLAFAYAPWRLAHAGHLHVLSTGGMALALAMLARGHGWSLRRTEPGTQPPDRDRTVRRSGSAPGRRVRPGWIIGGWAVAAWQISLGFGVGLIFGYVLAVVVLSVGIAWVIRRLARRPRQRIGQVVMANLIGGGLFGAVSLLMAVPYLTVVRLYPQAQRALSEVDVFSPPLHGFLIAPQHSWLWGGLHEGARTTPVRPDKGFWAPEMALLPGYVLLALAIAGLAFSIWSVRTRLWLAGAVLVTVGLAMGTELFDGALYEPLYESLPGWDALRTPGRIVIWTTLLLAVLAAGAVSAIALRARQLALARGYARPGGWLRTLLLIPAVLVLLEGVGTTPQQVVPPQPTALASVEGPVLVLPSNQDTDVLVMLWTTDRFVPLANGGSGFSPPSQGETRTVTQSFPDRTSVDYLRSIGVSTVVVLPEYAAGTPWERAVYASGQEFGLRREEVEDAVVFHLDG